DLIVTGVQTCALPISARVGSCNADTAADSDSLHSDHRWVEIDLSVDQFRVDEFGGIAEGESKLPKSGLLHHSGRDLLCVLVGMRSEERRVGKEGRCSW